MNVLLHILGFTIPSLIVFLTAFFAIKHFVENDQKKRLLELKYQSRNVITPIRLQAYERMAMFLERIEPNQLVYRGNNQELTAYQVQTLLLTTVRSEFEHNLSQQVYLSPELWENIKMAKEKVVNVINISAGGLGDEATGTDLITNILQHVADQSPTEKAMMELKKEIAILY